MAEHQSKNELTLAPNEFAWIIDKTTGIVKTYSGPINSSLTATEEVVIFDHRSKQFNSCSVDDGKQLKIVAPEGWYLTLKNPASNGKQPTEKDKFMSPDLDIGRKVNIAGPICFALWPGQMATTVQGHHLRQDEYLLARVYDSRSAQQSYEETVVVTKNGSSETENPDKASDEAEIEQANETETSADPAKLISKKDLTTGKLFIIKGTEASFYIPPTGIEIVKENGTFTQEAVSLERQDYCLLLDQSGNKRYVQGPAVVFPNPTETFVSSTNDNGETVRKFQAIELGPKQGIYAKVIEEYKEENQTYSIGKELFITGEDTPIYFPREAHSIVKYGDDNIVHNGVAIPTGEARYVMERLTGEISLEKGPTVFLPNPIRQLIVRRYLPLELCKLMYPGNETALNANKAILAQVDDADGVDPFPTASVNYVSEDFGMAGSTATYSASAPVMRSRRIAPSKQFSGDSINREGQYKPPRSITLDSKYDGAVTVRLWSGYAMMLVNNKGGRRVVQGPETALLEYDEVPHVSTLSTGKPKTTDHLYKTVYLRITNNYVTDIIEAETKDYVTVNIKLSYRLNFEGDPNKWFSVENYVKLLCDHMRSMIRSKVRQLLVNDFYHTSTDILRDLVLGKSDEETGLRPGRVFDENGMRIIDVEVLKVNLNTEMQILLESREKDTIEREIKLDSLQKELEYTRASERIKQERIIIMMESKKKGEEAERIRIAEEATTRTEEIEVEKTINTMRSEIALAVQKAENQVAEEARNSDEAAFKLQSIINEHAQKLEIEMMRVNAESTKDSMGAMTPGLIAALQGIADQGLLVQVAQAMSTQGMLRTMKGESVLDILSSMLKGSQIGDRIGKAANGILEAGTSESQVSPPAE